MPAMDLVLLLPILTATGIISTSGEPAADLVPPPQDTSSQTPYGNILRPPPPPVPFHGGQGSRLQRQNVEFVGYQYPPPPPPQLPPTAHFRLPAPFYKPINYNFVPPPQPFLTTPSPSVFGRLQSWLFPPSSPPQQQIIVPSAVANLAPAKKECNPCNYAPWIPVIRYNNPVNLNLKETIEPTTTYGPPAASYGPPATSYGQPASSFGPPTSTLPHIYRQPHPFYGVPKKPLTSTYIAPSNSYGPPTTTAGTPVSSFELPLSSYVTTFNQPTTTYSPIKATDIPLSQIHNPIENGYRLPKVSYPTGFKNSYGEPVTLTYPYNELYPASAAESSKIRPEVVPAEPVTPNVTYSNQQQSSSNNKGRGIHTLQPVALPNLSVSPLPPIFNARPFRTNIPMGFIRHAESSSKDVNVVSSIPLAEFTSSIEYPVKYIQSPIIDINVPKKMNQTKSYRIIPYSDPDTEQDAASQASESHTASANNIHESSFESTGTGAGNELYDGFPTLYNKQNEGPLVPPPKLPPQNIPQNHRPEFEDLKGLSDATDENGLKSDQHLQSIDSPFLYLRPMAPHKEFTSLFSISSTDAPMPPVSEFEIYDEIPTSTPPTPISTQSSVWSTNGYFETSEKPDENYNPKIVQIIIPYTSGNKQYIPNQDQSSDWDGTNDDYENQARKVPSYTEGYSSFDTFSDGQYTTPTTVTLQTETESDYSKLTAASILNDLYDVKEPPFDIVELQHNIDGWTEQEYKHYKLPHKLNYKGKYVKNIPEEYFTTAQPNTLFYTSPTSHFKEAFYEHEGAGSVQHTMKDDYDSGTQRSAKQYNSIQRYNDRKVKKEKDATMDTKPHIYTAASRFRSSSTTAPPWGEVETSISPLTKEKVYVVTARPWRENRSQEWTASSTFESQKTSAPDSSASASDNLPFKSPRFSNRPFVPPSTAGRLESMKAASSLSLGKSWHHSINALEWSGSGDDVRNSTSSQGDDPEPTSTPTNINEEKTTSSDTTAEIHEVTAQS